jgi:hypothetical protein
MLARMEAQLAVLKASGDDTNATRIAMIERSIAQVHLFVCFFHFQKSD